MAPKRGFGATWWGRRWLEVLESFGWDTRLRRGRAYARAGNVLEIDIKPGVVSARVQGSRPRPYRVSIEVKTLSDREWERVTGIMAGRAVFAALLLAGEMPRDIEEAFRQARLSLFPRSAGDIRTDCSCPDWANPCKHIAAVYYLLGEKFDEDPFFLFLLRGRTREQLISALREKRAARVEQEQGEEIAPASPEPAGPSLEGQLDRFWDEGEELAGLRFLPVPPEVEAGLLKTLGPPPFWKGKEPPEVVLAGIYRLISRRAQEEWPGDSDRGAG
ncbi:putative Zn finger protein [Desulfofundulus luciae]|uniref:Zn finger protein n=1 Tax=Desulfofundulus luciae TaxID=74702 RepID=A0ABU0AY64_9FIRM|nr:SWIM zinc finger family protein [Desulfofundulus luciae]MDQ0285425.1 putative Zn finger protein [Desulfofundulus luciae]